MQDKDQNPQPDIPKEPIPERSDSPGWGELSTGMRIFFILSGLLALLLGTVLGVYLTFSSLG